MSTINNNKRKLDQQSPNSPKKIKTEVTDKIEELFQYTLETNDAQNFETQLYHINYNQFIDNREKYLSLLCQFPNLEHYIGVIYAVLKSKNKLFLPTKRFEFPDFTLQYVIDFIIKNKRNDLMKTPVICILYPLYIIIGASKYNDIKIYQEYKRVLYTRYENGNLYQTINVLLGCNSPFVYDLLSTYPFYARIHDRYKLENLICSFRVGNIEVQNFIMNHMQVIDYNFIFEGLIEIDKKLPSLEIFKEIYEHIRPVENKENKENNNSDEDSDNSDEDSDIDDEDSDERNSKKTKKDDADLDIFPTSPYKERLNRVLTACVFYPLSEIKEFVDFLIQEGANECYYDCIGGYVNNNYDDRVDYNEIRKDTYLYAVINCKETISLIENYLTMDDVIYLRHNSVPDRKFMGKALKGLQISEFIEIYDQRKSEGLNELKKLTANVHVDLIADFF